MDEEDVAKHTFTLGGWREIKMTALQEIPPTKNNNATVSAKKKRDTFAKYFMEEGAVGWQLKMIPKVFSTTILM